MSSIILLRVTFTTRWAVVRNKSVDSLQRLLCILRKQTACNMPLIIRGPELLVFFYTWPFKIQCRRIPTFQLDNHFGRQSCCAVGAAAAPMLTGRDGLPCSLMFSLPHLTSFQCKSALAHAAFHPSVSSSVSVEYIKKQKIQLVAVFPCCFHFSFFNAMIRWKKNAEVNKTRSKSEWISSQIRIM